MAGFFLLEIPQPAPSTTLEQKRVQWQAGAEAGGSSKKEVVKTN
jgi:hypothetical protein